MTYAQEKKGQRLHLVYNLPNGLTQPVCGRTVSGYRMTINIPMGSCCKNCRRRINSKSFDENKFLIKHLQ